MNERTIRVALVAAVAQNGVIGAGGRLPWRIADDLKWFKSVTLGKPIVMGRKTFESIGKTLPGRDNIVVTRMKSFAAVGAIAAPNVDAALEAARTCAKKRGADEICVIGGGEIYAQTIAAARRIYLTRVEAAVQGDARFPQINLADWRQSLVGRAEKGPKNAHSCAFFVLDRIAA